MFHASHLKLSLLAASALISTQAFAQDGGAPRAQAASEIDEVVVTARRRDERLQDVPVAISVVRGADLTRLSVDKAEDLQRVAPGFNATTSVYGASNLTPTIRSQRQGLNNGTYDASVGVYFAEVAQARTQGLNTGMYDLDSVQVLKGPQGTLFGRNTTGGALLISPKAPIYGESEGYVQGTFGNFGTADAELAVNLPVGETVALRLSGKPTRHDGYLANSTMGYAVGDANVYSWRAALKFQLGESVENTLFVTGFHERDDAIPYRLKSVNPVGPLATLRNALPQAAELAASPFWTTTAYVKPMGTEITTTTAANITTIDLGGATLKNILGYRRTESSITFNLASDRYNSYNLIATDNGTQWSNELSLSGDMMDGNLDYFAGLFYFNENNYSSQYSQIRAFQPLASDATSLGPNVGFTVADPIKNTSYSAYGQVTYHIPDTGFSLTGGMRWTKDKREITWRNKFVSNAVGAAVESCRLRTVAANGVATFFPLSACFRDGSKSFSKLTYTLTADYKPNDDTLIYLAHRRGYRAGGFTFTAYTQDEATPFKPEVVNDFELGAKSVMHLDGDARLHFEAAAYLQKYKDIQKLVNFIPPGQVSPVVYYQTAAKATIKGFELSAGVDFSAVELNLGYAYSDPQYKKFLAFNPGTRTIESFAGARFAGAPKHSLSWLARVNFAGSEEMGQFYIQGSGIYQSNTVAIDITNYNPITKITDPNTVIASRHVVDARLQWSGAMGTPVDVQLYVRNLFKKKYITSITDAYSSLGMTASLIGDPRTMGIVVKYDF